MDRSEWLVKRREGLGGSDAAGVLGISPFADPMKVWLDKMGLLPEEPPDPERDFLRDFGQEIEPIIGRMYERKTERRLTRLPEVIRKHAKYPEIMGTPDFISEADRRVVEIKSENQFINRFGDPGTDQVPDYYRVQADVYMALLDFPRCDFGLLHGGSRFAIYTVERDERNERELLDFLRGWWADHVVKQSPPPIDGSDSWRLHLARKYIAHTGAMVSATLEAEVLAEELRIAREAEAAGFAARAVVENKLKAIIGSNLGLEGDFGAITWKKTKDQKCVDYERALLDVRNALGLMAGISPKTTAALREIFDSAVEKATTTKPGVRRFLFSPPKGANNGVRFINSASQ